MKALSRGTVHGLLFLIVLTLLVHALSLVPFLHDLRLSPMVLGVIVGMILANTVRSQFPESWDGGLKIASKQILRAGIVLYGFRLSFGTLLAVGGGAILIDVIIVAGTLISGTTSGERWAWTKTNAYSSPQARLSVEQRLYSPLSPS